MLPYAALQVVRHSDVQRRAMFVGKDIDPIAVIRHLAEQSEMFRFAQHDRLKG